MSAEQRLSRSRNGGLWLSLCSGSGAARGGGGVAWGCVPFCDLRMHAPGPDGVDGYVGDRRARGGREDVAARGLREVRGVLHRREERDLGDEVSWTAGGCANGCPGAAVDTSAGSAAAVLGPLPSMPENAAGRPGRPPAPAAGCRCSVVGLSVRWLLCWQELATGNWLATS